MNPNVNPLFFYLVGVVESLTIILCIFCIISTIVACVCGIFMIIKYCDCDGDIDGDSWRLSKRILKWSIVLTIIFWTISIFIPSKEVLIEMEVAKYATPDNIKTLVTEILSTVKEMIK